MPADRPCFSRAQLPGDGLTLRFLSSSVGTKILVALTGLLRGVPGHAPGRQPARPGRPHAYNAYSHKLISNPLIYIARSGLVALFLTHAFKAVVVTLRNREARRRLRVKKRAGHTSRKSLRRRR